MADSVFVDVKEKQFAGEEAPGTEYGSFGSVAIGTGSKVFRGDKSGIWLGAEKFADAPFRVDMEGNLTATSLAIGYIPTGGAASDINSNVSTINADKINISGATTFASGYNPFLKVDSVGGTYETSASTVSRVEIFPDANTGIVAYASNGTSIVFRVVVGGSNVGDVQMGNYSGGSGVLWDQSDSTLKIKGDFISGNIDADSITTGVFSTSRIPNLAADIITSGTLNANTINVTNLNASNMNQGTLLVGGAGKVGQIIITQGTEGSAYLRFGSSSGSRIWVDSGGDMGLNALGGNMYFYVDSYQKLVLNSNAQAVIGRDATDERTGLFVWGSFNVDQGDARITGKLRVSTSSSTSDDFHVGGHSLLEGNVASNHHDPRSNKSYNLGSDSKAWDYVYADDFINKSMGWYDDGVELQDGTIVSDMEALRQIKPHSTMLNKNGSRKLDSDSLPKAVFRQAKDRETGKPYKRNKHGIAISPDTGEEIGDGESLTHMVSVVFGALKEVDARVMELEKRP